MKCVSDVVSTDNIKSNMFPHTTTSHQSKQEYIYEALSAISYNDETCSSLCYMHIPSNPKCHFFIQYGGICMLGNFESTGTYSAPNDAFTANFNESKLMTTMYFVNIYHCNLLTRVFAQFISVYHQACYDQ